MNDTQPFRSFHYLATDGNAWVEQAACRGLGHELFFDDANDNRCLEAAEYYCSRCPVQRECLSFAKANRIHDGIWGGLNVGLIARRKKRPA